jgi:hypothetical protein
MVPLTDVLSPTSMAYIIASLQSNRPFKIVQGPGANIEIKMAISGIHKPLCVT